MKKMFHKLTALALAVCMICSFGVLGASAAEPYTDGTYTGTFHMLQEGSDKLSMCDPLFCHTADITVKGDSAAISLYIANPIPAFPAQGSDGTVKDVRMTLDAVPYEFVSDMETNPLRTFDAKGTMFGIKPNDELTCQVLTVTVPTAGLDSLLAAPAKIEAYLNVAMNSTQIFRIQMTGITKVEAPDETRTDAMQITAVVEAAAPSYDVVIPESVAMGTLSKDAVNTTAYQVQVEAANLGTGKVVVSAPAQGRLTSGENTLAYANSFGAQETSVTADLNGAFTVKGADVAKVAAGNYTGTVSFAIAYYAGK